MSNSPIYFFENGLRKVNPYYFGYKTHVKSRWIGKTLLEVFTNDFGQKPEIVQKEISKSLIYILSNYGRKDGPKIIKGWDNLKDRRIQRHDLIYNTKHMHEPTVSKGDELVNHYKFPSQSKTDIKIIFENDDILVVNKPSGVPTHPTSNYRHNSITEILKNDLKLDNIWPCHRLDRVTSGVLILGLTKESGTKMSNIITNEKDKTSKQYVARVEGNFPDEEFMITCPIFSINTTGGYLMQSNASNLPSNSSTIFRKLKYNRDLNQSIVQCKPITGRMHQIRIHLRNIGHPIFNDYSYNPIASDLLNHSINNLKYEIEIELYNRVFNKYPSFKEMHKVDTSVVNNKSCINIYEITNFETDTLIQDNIAKLKQLRKESTENLKASYNKVCEICERDLFDADSITSDLSIWLHSLRYEYKKDHVSFLFETDYPTWCNI